MSIEKIMIEALRERYRAKIKEAHAVIKIYLKNPVGIGDHPDFLSVIDSQLAKAAEADDKLVALEEYLHCQEGHERST